MGTTRLDFRSSLLAWHQRYLACYWCPVLCILHMALVAPGSGSDSQSRRQAHDYSLNLMLSTPGFDCSPLPRDRTTTFSGSLRSRSALGAPSDTFGDCHLPMTFPVYIRHFPFMEGSVKTWGRTALVQSGKRSNVPCFCHACGEVYDLFFSIRAMLWLRVIVVVFGIFCCVRQLCVNFPPSTLTHSCSLFSWLPQLLLSLPIVK